METDKRLILLDPADNTLAVGNPVAAGEEVMIDGQPATTDIAADIGFKLARSEIRAGDKILKYGAEIGSATVDIAKGALVHIHNLKSDYIPTYTHAEGARFEEGQ